MTAASQLDLASVLEMRVEERPDKTLLWFLRDGLKLSYGEFDDICNRVANSLGNLRIGKGSFVAIMLDSGVEFVTASYALKKLGAVEVTINTEFRGPSLARLINLTEAPVLLVSRAMLPALAEVAGNLPYVRTVVSTDAEDGDITAVFGSVAVVRFEELTQGSPERPNRSVRDDELQAIIYTSGTTGPSKGCMLSHRYAVRLVQNMVKAFEYTSADRIYTCWPLYHVGGPYYDMLQMIWVGGSIASVPRFSASRLFDELRLSQATCFMPMGTVWSILKNSPPSPADRDHNVRFVWGCPVPTDVDALAERFGWKVMAGGGYSSTDGGNVALPTSLDDRPPPNCCGFPFDTHEVRVFDEHDREVPVGEEGEIVLRPHEPGVLSMGYFGMPEATLASRRNLWFHTGDVGRMDAEGRLYFLGRKLERIRSKGHMVSSFEVAEVLETHPSVAAVGIVPVASEMGDDEIHAFVEPREGVEIDIDELLAFCRDKMASFMVPSRVEIVRSLPRTSTSKVAINELKSLYARPE